MEYIDRTYRKHFRQDRWSYFTIAYKETDLCIGVDRGSWQPEIPVCAERFVRELRTDMDRWIGSHPDYAQALTPFQASRGCSRHIQRDVAGSTNKRYQAR